MLGVDGHSPVKLAEELFTEEDLTAYLDAIRMGTGIDLAARAIGSTGTVMRRLRKRDEAFRERFDEAYGEGQEHYRDRLKAQARRRALNAMNPSDRILEVELATHVPGYEHLRRDRLRHEGRIEHAITLDPALLDSLPIEELIALRDTLAKLGGEIIDGEAAEFHELPAA